MAKKYKNRKKQESRLDSNARRPGVNAPPKIGKKEYEADIFGCKLSW